MDTSIAEIEPTAEKVPKPPGRSSALDTFRGLTILLMLFVNNIMVAEVSPAIAHGEWSGALGLADVVFPWFLMAVGVALSFSWGKFQRDGSYLAFIGKAAKRTAILILLGMIVDSAVQKQIVIGLGVLQIIGLAFFIGALFTKLPAWAKATIAGVLLAGYAAFLHGGGDFTAIANATKPVNDALTPFGLRGLISALPTGGAVLLGAMLGDLWRTLPKHRIASSAVAGVGLTAIGFAWAAITPPLKPIWTPSYICIMLGFGGLVLAVFSLLESRVFNSITSPVRAAGTNPILAYVAPILVKVMVLQVWRIPGSSQTIEQAGIASLSDRFGSTTGPWVYTGVVIGTWWLILVWLDYKKIFLKV